MIWKSHLSLYQEVPVFTWTLSLVVLFLPEICFQLMPLVPFPDGLWAEAYFLVSTSHHEIHISFCILPEIFSFNFAIIFYKPSVVDLIRRFIVLMFVCLHVCMVFFIAMSHTGTSPACTSFLVSPNTCSHSFCCFSSGLEVHYFPYI